MHSPRTSFSRTSFATLQVGNGQLTHAEERAHFALWALLKSPLLIGADLRVLRAQSLAVLKAKELLAVNQDELGVAGDLVWKRGSKEVRGPDACVLAGQPGCLFVGPGQAWLSACPVLALPTGY